MSLVAALQFAGCGSGEGCVDARGLSPEKGAAEEALLFLKS